VPTLIVVGIVGFLAQLVDGALGMAYGVTSTSLVLAVGLSPAVASASVHMAELGTTVAAGVSHWRFGNVDWRVVRRIGIPGALGAFLGAIVLSSVSAELAKPWMAAVLFTLGVYVLWRFVLARTPRPKGRPYIRGRYLAGLGLGAGFIDATGGGGWGPVATPTLLATGKMEPRKVVGSVDTSEFLVALAASIGFLIALGQQGVSWGFVGALMAGGLIAAPIAAWLVQKVAPRVLGAAVGGLILITNARTILDVAGAPADVRAVVYAVLALVWVLALGFVVHLHRRAGVPLTSRHWAPRTVDDHEAHSGPSAGTSRPAAWPARL
jgi:uncharacterized membrane protein YfcA